MATTKEVYDSIVDAIQKQIDKLDDNEIQLTNEQIQELCRKVEMLNQQLKKYKSN